MYLYIVVKSDQKLLLLFFLSTMSVLLGQNWLKLQTQTQVYIPICMPDFNVSIFLLLPNKYVDNGYCNFLCLLTIYYNFHIFFVMINHHKCHC